MTNDETPNKQGETDVKLCMFSKMLQALSVREAAAAMKKMGFEGIDLTVRDQGHVLPENVEQDLPKAVEEIQAEGLEVGMLTTGITAADEPTAEAVFASARACGVDRLKLGYWKYEGFGGLLKQVDEIRGKLDGIEKLADKYHVTPCLHIHSGEFMTANAAVVYLMLQGRDPSLMAAYIDPGHMTVEGGKGGWKMGIDILSPYVKIVSVKDFAWRCQPKNVLDKKAWKPDLVPLDSGIVQWPAVIDCLRQIGFDGVITVHSEYHGLTPEQTIAQTEADLKYFKPLL